MVITEFHTDIGIGNQLFIYGNAYAIAKREHQKIVLFVTMEKMMERPYSLKLFSLDPDMIKGEVVISNIKSQKIRFFLIREIKRFVKYFPSGCLKEEKRAESRKFIEIPKNKRIYYLFGNYESYKYIDPVLSELKKQYKPNFPVSEKVKRLWEAIQNDENAVALHIRMGDFVKLNRNYPISYYENCIAYHKKRNSNAHFYLLTQDQGVYKYFDKKEEVIPIDLSGEENQDIVEWYCLVQCKNHILSNSTFSWWAAVLSETEKSIITIPTQRLYDLYDHKEGNSSERYLNFYRSNWIPVSHELR